MVTSQSLLIHGARQHLYLNLCSRPRGTLFFIHGGPGWADAPWAGVVCQRLWGEWNTVHWDQRGCNRSMIEPHDPGSPLTIEQMVRDGLEACQALQREFQIERPILVGHSWGAFLAVQMAYRAPELFRSYVGIGQLVANRLSEPVSLELCKRRAGELGRRDLLEELNAFPAGFYRSIKSLFRQREIVSELGGEFANPVDRKTLQERMFQSPEEYRSEWATLSLGCRRVCEDLWPELIERSLLEEVRTLRLPVTLLHGKQDFCTPSAPVIEWFDALSCTGPKELIVFDQSAHWPQIEENEKFARAIHQMAPTGIQ